MNDEPESSELAEMLIKVLNCKEILGYGYLPEEDEEDVAPPQKAKAARQKALPETDAQQDDSADVSDGDEEVDELEDLEMPQFPFYGE